MAYIKRLLIIFGLAVLSLPMIVFLPNEGTSDMGVWLEWTSHIDKWGPLNAYSIINTNHDYERSDYPPISFINLRFALKVAALGNVSWMIGIKIIILGYYLATWAALIYLATVVRRRSIWISIVVSSGLFLGGLYFVVNSEALSYLDITYAPWIVFSLALLARRKYLLSGICLALAILVKWMPVVMLPAFLFYFINKQGSRYRIDRLPMFKFFGGMMLIFSLLIVVFLLNHLSLFSLVESLRKAFDRPSLAPGAPNFNWIVNYVIKLIYPETYVVFIRNNIHIFQSISAVIFLFVDIAILKSFLKRKKDISGLLSASLMISWSYYIWRTAVHENHLFISVLTALCIAVLNTNRSNVSQYLLLSFIGLTQAVVFFGFPIKGDSIPFPDSLMVIGAVRLTEILAVFHVLIYLVYLRSYLQFQRRGAEG